MKIKVLVENTSNDNMFDTEHGLSLYIESDDKKILFDMGQSDLFERNAERLGVDLKSVNIAILSHGHYDHGGGLKRFFQINKDCKVYMSRYAFEPHYNGTEKYIGLDKSLEQNDRIIFTDGITKIAENLVLYSCNDSKKEFELGSFGLNMEGFIPDDFRHEHYLVVSENNKKILLSGCSHKGILNIEKWFEPDILIGGFHFSKLPLDETLISYAEYLDNFDTIYYTCHCTGTEQFNFMKKYVKNLNYLSCGQVLEI